MKVENRDKLIDVLCEGPDVQIDESVKQRLRTLKAQSNEDIIEQLLAIIDDCVYCSLTSDFTLRALHAMWLQCGGKEENAEAIRNTKKYDDYRNSLS